MKKQKNNTSNLSVRIISGVWKGRNIKFLNKKDLRPTKNQIRETLFNWLRNHVEGSICIDLFAGSGALGFESASRGARKVYMIDSDINIVNCLKKQKDEFNAKNIIIYKSDANDFIKEIRDEIDIIFIDPPFDKDVLNLTINNLSLSKNLKNKCKIYVEMPFIKNFENNIDVPMNWELLKNSKSGDVAYLLFQHNDSMI